MFKKAAVFTDIHFGLKSNSRTHNADCEDFVDWYIETAKANGCETGIFCGDWHHNRNSLNLTTMDSTIRSMEKLGQAFDQFFFFEVSGSSGRFRWASSLPTRNPRSPNQEK